VAHRGYGADAIALFEARARLRTEPCWQLDLERAGLGAHLHREAGLAQHLEHPVVLRVHPRDERRDPRGLGELGEVRQQDGRDPVPLPRIGDREGQLGTFDGLGDEAGVGDDRIVAASDGHESGAERDHLIGRAVDVDAEAEEAKPARLLRQSAEEGGHAVHVCGDDGAQVEGGAVAQDDIGAGRRDGDALGRGVFGDGGRGHGLASQRPTLGSPRHPGDATGALRRSRDPCVDDHGDPSGAAA
jgi:hypothetical protein